MTVKEIRSKLGLSQKEFAEYMNIPKRTIQSWEQNYRNVPDYVMGLILRILKLENKLDTED